MTKGGTIYNHSALSRNWVKKSLLPGSIQLRRQTVYDTAGYHGQAGCQLILVEQGRGTLLVNGESYPLEPGCCCLLFMPHFYAIRSASGEPLTILFCPFSYSTYEFLTTISWFDFYSITQPSIPFFVKFDDKELAHIRRIVDAMSHRTTGGDDSTPLLLEWLVRLHRQYMKELKKQTP